MTDSDLSLMTLADQVEVDEPDWAAFIRSEVDLAPTWTSDYLRVRRALRRRVNGHADPEYEAWVRAMLWGRTRTMLVW